VKADLTDIREIKKVFNDTDANDRLDQGWVLLDVRPEGMGLAFTLGRPGRVGTTREGTVG